MSKLSIIPAPKSINILREFSNSQFPVIENRRSEMGEEAFHLRIGQEAITIEASSESGFYYGEKALEQLRFQFPDKLPCLELCDSPAYHYRSFHIDTARHFVPLEELKRMAQTAAGFRLNKFHWHFSDDQGWRIESKTFPRLHEIGARRKGDHMGKSNSCAEEHFYYTQEEVRELVSFCRERSIEIVPEIDIPGHVTALLAAYPMHSCTGAALETATSIGIFPDILCPGKEDTFTFLFTLLDEMCGLFPGKYFHIGGDETPKIRWKDCPACQSRMKQEGFTDARQLQGWMMNRIAAHLRTHGKRTIVWNEAALGGNLDTNIIIQVWNDDPKDPSLKALSKERDANGNPTSPNQGISARLLQKGHDLIISNMLGSYCDYPYAYIKPKMIYEWPIIPQKCEALHAEAAEHILGLECLIWTEHIRDAATLERLAWPRFAAKAERAWLGEDAPGYKDFSVRMKVLFPYLAEKVPGAAPPSGWSPGPVRSMKEMLDFMKNISQKDRKGYQEAQAEV